MVVEVIKVVSEFSDQTETVTQAKTCIKQSEKLLQSREPHQTETPVKISLHVGGQSFTTTAKTLLSQPDSLLGGLASHIISGQLDNDEEHFYDRDSDMFREVIRFYRTGHLHLPANTKAAAFKQELKFWMIDETFLNKCGCCNFVPDENLEKQFNWFLKTPIENDDRISCCRWRIQVWYILTVNTSSANRYPLISQVFAVIYLLFAVTQMIALALSTHPNYIEDYAEQINNTFENDTKDKWVWVPISERTFSHRTFSTGELFGVFILRMLCSTYFILEWVVRFLTCPNIRLFYRSKLNILDQLLITIEFTNLVIVMFHSHFPDQVLWIANICAGLFTHIRVLRLLSYGMHYSGLQVILLTLYCSRREILLLFTILAMSVLTFAPFIQMAETGYGGISNTFIGYWWVLVTMTTVGYGDYYPVTLPGCTISALVMIVGMMLTALPVAIIGNNFNEYYEYSKARNIHQQRIEAINKTSA